MAGGQAQAEHQPPHHSRVLEDSEREVSGLPGNVGHLAPTAESRAVAEGRSIDAKTGRCGPSGKSTGTYDPSGL